MSKIFKNGVYKGYIPHGLPQHKPRQTTKYWWKVVGKPTMSIKPKQEPPEWNETPQYPALNDGSREGIKRKVRTDWYDSLKAFPTVDQKVWDIIRVHKHNTAMFKNGIPAYNSLPIVQYLTRTTVVLGLPDSKYSLDTVDNDTVELVRDSILNQIKLSRYENFQRLDVRMTCPEDDKIKLLSKTSQKVAHIISAAKKANPDSPMNDTLLDLNPYIHSWWWHSGFEPPNDDEFYKNRKDADGNINQMVQLITDTALNLRSDKLLEPIVSLDDPLVINTDLVPNHRVPLRHYGAEFKQFKPVMLPGYWHERTQSFEFPHTSFLTMDCLKSRQSQIVTKQLDDFENCLDSQAIMTGFGWLNSLALYNGFTPYQEVDYPLTCQLITTDGQRWMFHVYQMNTHSFHRDLNEMVAKKNNVCWSSSLMNLYEAYEDGKFRGINDDVIRTLVKFMSVKPSESFTAAQELRPYLGVDERSDSERQHDLGRLRWSYANLEDVWWETHTRKALWEKIFFEHPETRHVIQEMKPPFHVPQVEYPEDKFE